MGSKYDGDRTTKLFGEYSQGVGLFPVKTTETIVKLGFPVDEPLIPESKYQAGALNTKSAKIGIETDIGDFLLGYSSLSLESPRSGTVSNFAEGGRGYENVNVFVRYKTALLDKDFGSNDKNLKLNASGGITFLSAYNFNQLAQRNVPSHYNLEQTNATIPSLDLGFGAEYTYGRFKGEANVIASMPLGSKINFQDNGDSTINPTLKNQLPEGVINVSGNPLTVSNTMAEMELAYELLKRDGFNAEVFANVQVRPFPEYQTYEKNGADDEVRYEIEGSPLVTGQVGIRVGLGEKQTKPNIRY